MSRKNSGDMQYAIKALDASTACIPNLVELEDRIGCQKIEQSAQELTSLLPAGTDDREEFTWLMQGLSIDQPNAIKKVDCRIDIC